MENASANDINRYLIANSYLMLQKRVSAKEFILGETEQPASPLREVTANAATFVFTFIAVFSWESRYYSPFLFKRQSVQSAL